VLLIGIERAWIAVALVPALLAGCVARQPGPATAAHIDPPPMETSELAEQARRDVEQLRQLRERREAEARSRESVASAEPQTPPRPPAIQWTRPRGNEPADDQDGQTALNSDGGSIPATEFPLPMPMELPGGSIPTDAIQEGPDADRMRALIVDLSAELYRRGAYSDMPLRELLLIAATTMVTPDRTLIPDALPGLTEREREIVGLMQEFFRELGRKLGDTGDPEVLLPAVAELGRSLENQPRLALVTVALCTRVGGFGDYDEFAHAERGGYVFLAHTGQQAVVYLEVENFTSELDGQGRWVTHLAQQLVVISDRDGIPVWREDWQRGTDMSKNRREDFFIVQVITLPKRLSVGRYQLKILIRDERSGSEAEAAINFEMVADPKMTGN
jgi:hypothetical protein